MALATDAQVQQYVNERIRVRAEQIRALLNALLDDKAVIDDIYAACAQQNPTWIDQRPDGPPHFLEPSDVLAYNAYITALMPHIKDAADYPVIVKSCVTPL